MLECCAGDGVVIKAIKDFFRRDFVVDAVEVREEEEPGLIQYADDVYIQDFLTFAPSKEYKTIITNPPYSIAQEIVEHCFEIAPDAEIIMLLRLAFLESKKRKEFWQKYPLSELYVLSERPSFTGKGTDSTAYAWMVWNKNKYQRIEVI